MKKTFNTFTLFVLVLSMLTTVVIPSMAVESATVTGFSDVKESAWYYKAVTYCAENGLMAGMGEGKFSPNVKFTRAMAVQLLAKISGEDLSGYTETDYPDVIEGQWYVPAIAWATENKIVAGVGNGFAPNAVVTREQLARMVHQFAEKYAITNLFACGPESADGFADGAKISSWATEGMEWAIYNGILSGTGANKLDPRGTATRAQAAQIFFCLHFMKTDGVLPPDTKDFDALDNEESDAIRIFCWGDSMTAGGYPEELRDIAYANGYSRDEFVVYNYGAGGDTAEHVAMKQGGMPMYVAPVTIPADKTPVRIYLYDENYQLVESLADLGTKGLTPITIAGQTGQISRKYDEDKDEEMYFFTRQGSGKFEEVTTTRLTRVVTKGMTMPDEEDFHVIFSGPSNNYSSTDAHKLIATQERMIDYIGTDNYIIISLTSLYYMPNIWDFNADLAEHYGDHFLDFRSYVLERGLQDAGIEPTEQDLADIAIGEIPASLRANEGRDMEHGNTFYNKLLGQQVYNKLVELGYIEATA